MKPSSGGQPLYSVSQSSFNKNMPTQNAKRRAQTKKRQGKAPTTQAGEFIRSEMRKMKRGKGNAQSRKQAIAIGLSEARQDGVRVPKKSSKKK